MAYWLARRPRLTLRFEPVIFAKTQQGQRSLLAVFEARTANAADINWFFDLRLINEGRSRIQITSLSISQARSTGARDWDAKTRLGNGIWLEPGETGSYRFTDADLDESSLGEPFLVIVPAIAMPYRDAKESGQNLESMSPRSMCLRLQT